MDNRRRPAVSSNTGSLAMWSSSFPRQPARVLIVEALPPWWSETCAALCDALDNFLSLACNLDGPTRIPLLSLYAISRQQECLLPFVVRGNFARLHSCIEELRSIPGEGCVRGAARGGELLRQAVLDSLQQFKQYIRHTSSSSQASNNLSVEMTVVTSQPGRAVVHHLEKGLKDADLMALKRLLVVQVYAGDVGQDASPPEDARTDNEDSLMLGTEVDLQQVDNSVLAMEMVLKAWLHEQGGDREQLHLLLPGPQDSPSPVCVKCDMQERLISPALMSVTPSLGVKTESIRDFLPAVKGSADPGPTPQRLKAIKVLRADGVCESVLYGLPLVIRPTTCWQLDWDEMETNHSLFHALCHTLRSRDLFLLLQVESAQKSIGGGTGVSSYYVLQPSSSLSLLLKPVVSRELLLPCSLPVTSQDPAPFSMQTIQDCLAQLDEDFVLNPLSLSSHLHQHLRSRGLLPQPRYPYRSLGVQPQNRGRQLGAGSRVRATVAPLPSSSSSSPASFPSGLGPPPAKASRPALSFLSSGSGRRAPAPTRHEEVDDDVDLQ